MLNDRFRILIDRLCSSFPKTPPEVVVGDGDGDYGQAPAAFATHASEWDCSAVFQNGSVITFVNEAAFVFLLPRFLVCVVKEDGTVDFDILEYVAFGLFSKREQLDSMLSVEQKQSLAATLAWVTDYVKQGCGETQALSRLVQIVNILKRSD